MVDANLVGARVSNFNELKLLNIDNLIRVSYNKGFNKSSIINNLRDPKTLLINITISVFFLLHKYFLMQD